MYWFVPDGFRADPDVFNIYQWAREGKLPNIKRMMEEGSYGYSIPVFPSHTPVNFASLFTGVYPKRHGVADGPIRIWGYPLNIVARSGFSSLAKTIDPFWFTLEQAGKIVTLLSVPGTTPPEITRGNVIKGRWGGWGMEFPSLIFHSHKDKEFRELLGWNDKVFQIEKKLTEFPTPEAPHDWTAPMPQSYSPPREVNLKSWDTDLFALIVNQSHKGEDYYDTVYFSKDKKTFFTHLKEGEWSNWFFLNVSYRLNHNYQEELPQRTHVEENLSKVNFDIQARLKVIKLGDKDFFRFRLLYDSLNESLAMPASLNETLHDEAGPMVDFVDNFPPQLIYFPEDRATFLEEAEMSWNWHEKAQAYFLNKAHQDVMVQSIYSPNQMLTSRWWMGYLDPRASRYHGVDENERKRLWGEVLTMYQHVDKMIGEALDHRPKDGYVVLSSDHGVAPLNCEVRLNNFFARHGWLKFHYEKTEEKVKIDWPQTKVVFLNMTHVYINPDGLGGPYYPAKGKAYEQLRQEVAEALKALKDDKGIAPLSEIRTREEAGQWGLPENRVGDLLIANHSGYSWIEDVTEDLKVFVPSLKAGYKQSILPTEEKALWTPFMIVGPGVKAGHQISRPISHLEQYPTIMKLLGVKPTYTPDAEPLQEILN